MVAKTLYPALAKAKDVSSPMPLFAPVIITDLIIVELIVILIVLTLFQILKPRNKELIAKKSNGLGQTMLFIVRRKGNIYREKFDQAISTRIQFCFKSNIVF